MSKKTGTVKWFNNEKGFGFIVPDEQGPDMFVHITDVKDSHLDTLGDGDKVEYDVDIGYNDKEKAVNINITS